MDNQSLSLVINLLGELGRNGMVGSWVLHNETRVSRDTGEYGGLFNRPGTDVGPILFRLGILLLGV